GVGHADASGGRRERRLDRIGIRNVAAMHVRGALGTEHPGAAAVGVENGREDARRVEIRKTPPVDRAVPGHQRRRAAVADERVITKRGVGLRDYERSSLYACLTD